MPVLIINHNFCQFVLLINIQKVILPLNKTFNAPLLNTQLQLKRFCKEKTKIFALNDEDIF